jgi:hypothetical protein
MSIRQLVAVPAVLLGLVFGTTWAQEKQETGATAPAATAPGAGSTAPSYQPKFAGDPARSEDEAGALGYMRVVTRAQKDYFKKHNQYAATLAALVGTGSFTKRMAQTTERGEYHVGFKGKKDGYVLILTPKQMDAQHRSFYADETGIIHADEEKPAGPESAKVK